MLDKYRVHQVAKDLGVSNKYVIDLMEKHFGEQKKHMTALTEEELNVVFENVTQNNEVKSFDNYFAQKDKKSVDVKEDIVDNKNEIKQTINTADQANKKPFVKNEATEQPNRKPFVRNEATEQSNRKPFVRNEATEQSNKKPFVRNEATEQANKKPFVRNEATEQSNRKPFVRNEATEQANKKPFVRNETKVENGYRKPEEKATEYKKFEKKDQAPRRFGENKPGDRKPASDKFKKPAFQNNNAKKPTVPSPKQNTQNHPKTQLPNSPAADAAEVKRVAMRAADINVEKYNERYEQIAPTNLSKKDTGVKKQKFGGRPNRRNFMSKKDREAEKLRKLEVERERRKKLVVSLPEEMTVGDLALALKIQSGEIIKKLMGLGVMAGVNEIIDFDTAETVAMELGAKVEREVVVTIEERLFDESEDETDALAERPPVVVVMGHVDHGKTSILDAIRNADVTAGEAGGITQHIGAYQVKCNDKKITFLDTPGHEAFTSMRARGAQITDIAILVVAADDGIMPQTVEAINHATAAGMPIIVAINKIDKPAANPEKVKQELTEYNLVPEEWGGDVICVPVSAKTREGIDTLLEMVQLVAEMKELKANPDRMAKGTVIEARLDTGRGPIATVLVQNGTLKTGDIIIAGTAVGRVRVMFDDKGNKVDIAVPSTPVEITGLGEVPNAGDMLNAVEDEKLAKQLVEQRKQEEKEKQFSAYQKVTLDNLFEQIEEGEMKELPIIVKADVQGSAEAVKQSLEKISNEEVRVKVIHSAVGAVSKSDVMLANASNAIIVGFNVRPDPVAREDAEQNGVDIRLYRIIYDAIEEVTSAMKGMLTPKTREVDLGSAEVRQVYKITNVGTVSGCYVTSGKITRNALIRVVRDGIIIADDKLSSLKRFKDDAKEVAKGYECGATLEKYNDIKEGDVFEAYIIEEYTE